MPRRPDAAEGPLYLLARVRARLGHHAEALAVLATIFEGPAFYSEARVQRDPTFAALHADPDFPAHVARWAAQKGTVLLRADGAAPVR